MNFRYKCLLQRFFSSVPKGESLNYLFQKHVTKTLPPNNDGFLSRVDQALAHNENYKNYNELITRNNKYYEFGAGWTLTIPLTMTFLNFKVFCIDIRKLIIPELINDSLNRFQLNRNKLTFDLENDITTISNDNILSELANKYKLNYIAPKNARETGFEENSFDFISSSNTFEHIPKNDILPILKECYRIMSKGGVLSMYTDYQDHWSYFDKSISVYNFLKYSEKDWKKYNPAIHFQNRMRHRDYMNLIAQTDFKVVKEVPELPNEKDTKALESLKIAKEFEHYTFDDLAIRRSEVVLIK